MTCAGRGICAARVVPPLTRPPIHPPHAPTCPPPPLMLRATAAELAPLASPRDTLPEGRTIHRLTLTYKLTLAEGGKVTPTLPSLNRCARRPCLRRAIHVHAKRCPLPPCKRSPLPTRSRVAPSPPAHVVPPTPPPPPPPHTHPLQTLAAMCTMGSWRRRCTWCTTQTKSCWQVGEGVCGGGGGKGARARSERPSPV